MLLCRRVISCYNRCSQLNRIMTRTMGSVRLLPTDVGFKEFKAIVSTPEAQFLHGLFKTANYELRIAGGAVRDILRGQIPEDVDFATDATPTQMIDLLGNYTDRVRLILTRSGEQHGTVTARIDNNIQYEVTTLRIDKKTDGRHAEVEFITDWKLDANRRDLTINSMFLDFDGNIYDFFDGLTHLKENIVRFVGNAADRITEDYLRILRYFRFFARYGGQTHDEDTINAFRELSGGLANISGERLWSEMKKILPLRRSNDVIPVMLDVGIGKHIGLKEDKHRDLKEFHKVHSNLVSNQFTFEAMTLFASLFKDEDEVNSVVKRLKCSNLERNTALYIVNNRNQLNNDLQGIKESLALNGKADFVLGRKCALEYFKYMGDKGALEDLSQWTLPTFPVRGNVVLDRLENKKNKRLISQVILELKKIWVKSGYEIGENELLSEIPNVVKMINETKKLSEIK